MKNKEIIDKMTLEQKAAFVSGKNYWYTQEAKELGLPSIMMTDGPNGLRKQDTEKKAGGIGLGNSVPATCFPPAVCSASSWDEELLYQEGEAIAEECLSENVSVILGPGTNIKRSPTCGRNFEYFSEDPYLSGRMATSLVKGVQSKGVGTSLKHFACNSQEAFRMIIDEIIDERTIRELYFPAFEMCVKEAQPWTVMNSYNRINGVYSSQNRWLQEDVLRKEWGFEGLIVTDWGANVNRVGGLKCGTDLEMPTSGTLNKKKIIKAVKSGELDEIVLDKAVDNVIELIKKSKSALNTKHTYDREKHHEIAQRIAEGAMVLLKNDDNILPIKAGQKVAVIGEMAKHPRFQGAGTSVVNPTKLDNAYNCLSALGVNVSYARGYDRSKDEINNDIINEALELAESTDVVIVFAGLTEEFEAEGYDRKNIEMPNCHNYLISEIAKVNPNIVVVLAGGSVIHLPWANEVKGILNSSLGGQAGGTAVANIVTGKVNPSGKTCETYPLTYEDNPTYNNFPGGPVTSEHRESVYVGYRYYDTAKKDVLFPFGYGLSYTDFEFSDLHLSSRNLKDDKTLTVSFKIKNIGKTDGAEVAQIYVKDKESTIYRPEKELRAFKKIYLKAGEEKEVTVELSKRAFAFWNINIHNWMVETGEFEILAGSSSRDIKMKDTVLVESTDIADIPDYRETAPAYYTADISNMRGGQFEAVYGKPLPSGELDRNKKIDIYCCLNDAQYTKWGGKIGKFIKFIMTKMGSAENGDGAMLAAMATQIPIRNFVQMSMGVFSPKMAEGLLQILNDDESTFIGFNKIFWRIGGALVKIPNLFKSI
ncbi:MAG: glycoside hydrolase family 3 C-terminal domain-containing protein [Eubacterium sp.]|nr:glycoside hydrolase family 3 C-terminal domain-containing protein [Eubacterium sp.]